jgi:hypothetical protein
MPVPVAVTHPAGAGLVAAKPATLETSGPFARLAAAKEAAQRAAEEQQQQGQQQQQQQPQQQPQASIQQQSNAAQNVSCAGTSEQQNTVVINHLDFSYPGLGMHDTDHTPLKALPHPQHSVRCMRRFQAAYSGATFSSSSSSSMSRLAGWHGSETGPNTHLSQPSLSHELTGPTPAAPP